MKMFYISHPYTGDETRNQMEARTITATLKAAYPQLIFVNPLDAFQYAKHSGYEQILTQCIELLCRCDGIILTGKWRQSRGCMAELEAARKQAIPVTELSDWRLIGVKQRNMEPEEFKRTLLEEMAKRRTDRISFCVSAMLNPADYWKQGDENIYVARTWMITANDILPTDLILVTDSWESLLQGIPEHMVFIHRAEKDDLCVIGTWI